VWHQPKNDVMPAIDVAALIASLRAFVPATTPLSHSLLYSAVLQACTVTSDDAQAVSIE